MTNVLEKYYNDEEMMKECHWSKCVLIVIENDILDNCDVYNEEIKYAGKGTSEDENESLSSKLVPELGINHVFYIHDKMYELADKKILGYTKEFADCLMDNLMEMEGFFILDDLYYFGVKYFGS